jgi:AraC family transcriptional regulator of adaptative response/methylated-DNA-[protein]-cysteine methyltransferase
MPDLRRRTIETPVGPAIAGVVEPGEGANEPGGVCLLEFGEAERLAREMRELEAHFGAVFIADSAAGGSPTLDRLEAELGAYFAGRPDAFSVPLCTPGTAFQHRVWNAMRSIPPGGTVTYAELGERIGSGRASSRAVGAASGRNRVSILIPCHRVVDGAYDPESGGSRGLRGYGGGLEIKRALLELERSFRGSQPSDGGVRGQARLFA